MPSQFSLTDILAYVGSGLLFFVVIALVYPSLDAYKQVQSLSAASGILATFLLYICGYLIASVRDLIASVSNFLGRLIYNKKGDLFSPIKWLRQTLLLKWILKTYSSTAMNQVEVKINKLIKKYSNLLPRDNQWSEEEINESLKAIASSSEYDDYVMRLSSLQTFVGTSTLVCIVGILLSAIESITGTYKDLPHYQLLWLWFSIGLLILLFQNRYLLLIQKQQMWKQACKSLIESSRLVKHE